MRVLGIDPGLLRTGYACVHTTSRMSEPKLVEAGVLRISTKGTLSQRLHQLHTDAVEVMRELAPDCMFIEGIFSHPHFVRTAITMGHARGVLLLAAAQHKLPVIEVAPSEVKRVVVGRGHATKEQVRRAVMAQCRLRVVKGPSDVSDAIAIALCGARRGSSARVSIR